MNKIVKEWEIKKISYAISDILIRQELNNQTVFLYKLVRSQLFEGTALHLTFSYHLYVLFHLITYLKVKEIPVEAWVFPEVESTPEP